MPKDNNIPDSVMRQILMQRQREENSEAQEEESNFAIPSDYYDGEEPDSGEEHDEVMDPAIGKSIAAINSELSCVNDNVRQMGNVCRSIEEGVRQLCKAMGLDESDKSGKKTPVLTFELIEKIETTYKTLLNLEKNGFNAQLSESFDCLRETNIKRIIDQLDKRIDASKALSVSYQNALKSAIQKAVVIAVISGVAAGLLGSVICSIGQMIIQRM